MSNERPVPDGWDGSAITDAEYPLTDAHIRHLESCFDFLLRTYPRGLRLRALEIDSTPMSQGGRGIYDRVEARWLRARLARHAETYEGDPQ